MKKTVLFLSGFFLTWTLTAQSFIPQNSGLSSTIASINFANDNVGMAVSYNGEIVKTIDGGTNWSSQNSGTTTTLRDVVMIDAQVAVAIGYNGLILRTSDGGGTWTPVSSGTTQHLVCVDFNYSTLYATGNGGDVFKSVDSGLTWSTLTVDNTSNLKSIYFTDANTGYVGGEHGRIYKTINAGSSWTQLNTGIDILPGNYQLVGMCFTDDNNGFVVGGNAQTNQGVILRTTDAGDTWMLEFLNNNYIGSVSFLTSTTGFLSGGSIVSNTSTIMKTMDGGNTWNVVPTSSYRQVGASFPSPNAGYTCGLNGTILKIDSIILETDELTSEFNFEVFPNPGNGYFNLALEEKMLTDNTLVEVLNLNGEVVLKQGKSSTLDISGLISGVYFIRVSNDKFNLMKKVIKE
ncbi:T9SS type A sorting domain-containing protein [uncultured Fluviicola sp.]|uniref:T9SS type A sorting domain-containing protein n=1 Tax=uncultured Fluviicola sp. TaxID=463303 RepID=UPI0025FA476F|nr:T9SS type A sorting domain-containing protein [uncultured Fluviicola sp.]